MNKNENINELLLNLPDFINNKIEDKSIIEKIKNEIASNKDFKILYDNMKYSLEFMNKTELTPPPDYYFNNLLPNINQRIESGKQKSPFVWFGKIIPYWKYAVPVCVIALFFLIYDINYTDNKINVQQSTEVSSTLQEISPDSKIEEDNSSDSTDIALSLIIDEDTEQDSYTQPQSSKSFTSRQMRDVNNSEKVNETAKGLPGDLPAVLETIGDDDFFSNSGDDLNPDNDLNKLTPEQQKKVLNKIKNAEF